MAVLGVLGFAVVVGLGLPGRELGDRLLLVCDLAFEPGDLTAVASHSLRGRRGHGLGLATSESANFVFES